MFRGAAAINEGYIVATDNVSIFNVTHNTIVSYYVHVWYTCTCVLSYSKLVKIEMIIIIRNVINTKPLFYAHSMLLIV